MESPLLNNDQPQQMPAQQTTSTATPTQLLVRSQMLLPPAPVAQAYEEYKGTGKATTLLTLVILLLFGVIIFLIVLLMSEELRIRIGISDITDDQVASEGTNSNTDINLDLDNEGSGTGSETEDTTLINTNDAIEGNTEVSENPTTIETTPSAALEEHTFTTTASYYSPDIYKFTMMIPKGSTTQNGDDFVYHTISNAEYTLQFSSGYEAYPESFTAFEEVATGTQFGTVFRGKSDATNYLYTSDLQIKAGTVCMPFETPAPCARPTISDNLDITFRLRCEASTGEGITTCDEIIKSLSAEVLE